MRKYINVDVARRIIDSPRSKEQMLMVLSQAEPADVVEVKHGEWIPIDVGDCCYRCSVCNFVRDAYLLEEDNYCPHCGAKMDLQ